MLPWTLYALRRSDRDIVGCARLIVIHEVSRMTAREARMLVIVSANTTTDKRMERMGWGIIRSILQSVVVMRAGTMIEAEAQCVESAAECSV